MEPIHKYMERINNELVKKQEQIRQLEEECETLSRRAEIVFHTKNTSFAPNAMKEKIKVANELGWYRLFVDETKGGIKWSA